MTAVVLSKAELRVRMRELAVAMVNQLRAQLPYEDYEVELYSISCFAHRFGHRTRTPKIVADLPAEMSAAVGGNHLEVLIKRGRYLVYVTNDLPYYEPDYYSWVFDAVWCGRWWNVGKDDPITMETPIRWFRPHMQQRRVRYGHHNRQEA